MIPLPSVKYFIADRHEIQALVLFECHSFYVFLQSAKLVNFYAMCTLDIILSICLAASVIQGLVKGFTDQIIALVSIILGTWAAFKFSDLVCGWAGPYLHMSGQVLHVIVFILMIIAVIVVMHLLGKVIKASIKFVMLGWLDRLLGAVFALLKATLIIGVLIILFNTLNTSFHIVDEAIMEKSVLYSPIKRIAYGVFPYFKELLFRQ